LERLPAGANGDLALNEQGDLVVMGSELVTWRFPPRNAIRRIPVHAGITTARTSPLGTQLSITAGDGSVSAFDLAGRSLARIQAWDNVVVKAGAYSSDGALCVAATAFDSARKYETTGWTPHALSQQLSGVCRRVEFLGESLILTLPYSGSPRIYDLQSGQRLPKLLAQKQIFFEAWVVHGGAHGALLSEAGELFRLDRDPVPRLTRVGAQDGMISVAMRSDASEFYVGRQGDLLILDGESGALIKTISVGDRSLIDLAVSPDDRWVAAGTMKGEVLVWDRETWELRLATRAHQERVASVHFDQTRPILVSGSWDGTALFWGLGPLTRSADDLIRDVEQAWGLSLEDALTAPVR
jgi:WD40 repeat protein